MKKQKIWRFIGSVLVLVSLMSSPVVRATESDASVLTVSGAARLSVPADFASFSIGVQNSAAQAQTALQDNSRLMQRLQQALISAGVIDKELSSSAFSVQPQWQPRPRGAESGWQPAIIGYQVRTQLRLETSRIDQVANYIQAGVAAGANQVSQLRFSLQDNEAVYLQALAAATATARQRAALVAKAAGVTLGALQRIDVDPATVVPLHPAPRVLMASSRSLALPVVAAGEIEVRGAVRLSFLIQ